VFYKPSVLDEYGYFAGKDEDRANELMSMFSNKDIDASLN
jgi:muramoyltetrapeptide carboxypeptidase LdcA involved in peptidoglycan recycling